MEWYHLPSRCTYPYLTHISRSPLHVCQWFSIFCRHMSRKGDNPTIRHTFATIGVWNGTIFYLAAPIPILPKPLSVQVHSCSPQEGRWRSRHRGWAGSWPDSASHLPCSACCGSTRSRPDCCWTPAGTETSAGGTWTAGRRRKRGRRVFKTEKLYNFLVPCRS